MRLHNKSPATKHIHLEVMVIESDLDEVVVLDQKEDAMLNVSEGGRAGCGMEEQFHLDSYNIENSHAAKQFGSLSPVLDAKEHKEIKEIESGMHE